MGAYRQAVDADETGGGGVVELIPPVVGRQLVLIQGLRRPAAHYRADAPVQPYPRLAADITLGTADVGIHILAVAGEPQAVINHIGVFLGQAGLEAGLVFAQGQGFQGFVGGVQRHRRRRFINLPGLDAHQAVLYVIHPPDAVFPGDSVQMAD